MREDHLSSNNVTPDTADVSELCSELLDELADLPLAEPSSDLGARIEALLKAPVTDVLPPQTVLFRFAPLSKPFVARAGMAAAILMALGVGVLIGRGTSPVDGGQQLTSGETGQSAVQLMNETPAPSVFDWQHQPESDLVLVESAPVSPVMTIDDGQPARAWGTQGLRREVYIDKAREAQLELIQPEQRVIWVSQPVY